MEDVQQLETAGPQGAGFLCHQMGTLLRGFNSVKEYLCWVWKENLQQIPRMLQWGKSRPNCGEALVTQGCGEKWECCGCAYVSV